jgi:hypothetical protein
MRRAPDCTDLETSDNVSMTSQVTRTRSGTITDETLAGVDARPNAPNYIYDAVGRLTEATGGQFAGIGKIIGSA